MSPPLPSDLCETAQRVAEAVGFWHEDAPAPGDISPPEHVAFWKSDYALFALVPVEGDSVATFAAAGEHAVSWLDELIRIAEEAGRLIDGYLVLILSAPPDQPLAAAARNFEMDRRWCRRHVIWSSDGGDWAAALARVTCLSLPPRGLHTEPTELPNLSQKGIEVLLLFDQDNSGTVESVSRAIQERVNKTVSSVTGSARGR